MIYVRIVNANEIGIRKGGKSKRAGSFLMVSKKCLSFLPEQNPEIPDSTIEVQYISPNGQEMGLVDYVWHNKALHEDKSTRNEHRLYFTRSLDSDSYIEPDDIVIMKRVIESNFNGLKLFLFKKEKDKEYYSIFKLISGKSHSIIEETGIDYIDNYQFSVKGLPNVYIDDNSTSSKNIHDIPLEPSDKDIIAPSAASMIENLRSLGYSTEEAIADIIDNSISANAINIDIEMKWHGGQSYIAICDDGHGMDEAELIQAMRPGSKNPRATRESSDLGRFGMGMKSASFSLGKELTVFTRKNGSNSLRRWDLDVVSDLNEWKVLKNQSPDSKFNYAPECSSGTVVLIESLDRMMSLNGSGNMISDEDFYSLLGKVKFHLSLVFHRYITQNKVTITINKRKISPFDPHFDCFSSEGSDKSIINDNVSISSFIVPKESDLSVPIKRKLKKEVGFNQLQGVYIYRGDRIISYGGWLNLGRRHSMKINDDYALGRVVVELENSEDKNWQIDIKKSTAHPPLNMLPSLNRAAETVRKLSLEKVKMGTSRNRKVENHEGIWSKTDNKIKVDRTNSLYRIIASDSKVGEQFIEYIKSLEEKLPL
ncbi:ATP-binding protein [Vibrio alginolyticus]|uniref:ATP-binding protein n=1 Tax=Vibrio alginolyticus TaxID=663 RepID=UPI0037548A0E